MNYGRKMVESINEKYPPGTRIRLIHMDDPFHPVPDGTLGTVRLIDGIGQLHMEWDNGRTLALNIEVDRFEVIKKGNT